MSKENKSDRRVEKGADDTIVCMTDATAREAIHCEMATTPRPENKILYTTGGGHKVPIYFGCGFVKTEDVKIDLAFTRDRCSKCSSQAYSCPPFSPNWDKIPHKKYLAVFYLYIKAKEWWTYGSNLEFYVTNQISCILAPMLKECGYELEKYFCTSFHSVGSCRRCKPCRNKLGLPCAYPEKLRYALESEGVMVNSLTEPVGHKLLWKRRKSEVKEGEEYLPLYTTAVIAFDTDSNDLNTCNINKLLSDFMKRKELSSNAAKRI
jgi:predicted metal-binding protein